MSIRAGLPEVTATISQCRVKDRDGFRVFYEFNNESGRDDLFIEWPLYEPRHVFEQDEVQLRILIEHLIGKAVGRRMLEDALIALPHTAQHADYIQHWRRA